MKLNSKIILFLTIFVMLFSSAHAVNYSVYLHEINITVLDDGRADVVERFNLFFPNDKEKVAFRELSTQYGSDIDKWSGLNEIFQPNIGNQNLINKQISYNEFDATYLELRYSLVDSLMASGKENPNNTEYSLKATFLDNFFQTNVWVIPENTEISFILPARAEVSGVVEPEAQIISNGTNTIVKWTGYKSANRLTLKYLAWNAPNIDMDKIIRDIFYTFEGQVLVTALAIIIVIVFIERRKISAIIEDYVAENSKLSEN
jgi:hypothetical protein